MRPSGGITALAISVAIAIVGVLAPSVGGEIHGARDVYFSGDDGLESVQASTTPAPSPESQRHVLMVGGKLERLIHLAGDDGELADFAAKPGVATSVRFEGAVICIDKAALNWTEHQGIKPGTSGSVSVYSMSGKEEKDEFGYATQGHRVSSSRPISADGTFRIDSFEPFTEPGSTSEFIVRHNCTDDNATKEERFDMAQFEAGKPLHPYAMVVQGRYVLPTSHDSAINAKVDELFAFGPYSDSFPGSQINAVPKALFVSGKLFSLTYEVEYRLMGRLYNWDYDSMPDSATQGKGLIPEGPAGKVPLYFDGRVSRIQRRNDAASCSGMKISVENGSKSILSGHTYHDGTFHLANPDGGLLDLISPQLSEWRVLVELRGCNATGIGIEEPPLVKKFRLVGAQLDSPHEFFKRVALQPIHEG